MTNTQSLVYTVGMDSDSLFDPNFAVLDIPNSANENFINFLGLLAIEDYIRSFDSDIDFETLFYDFSQNNGQSVIEVNELDFWILSHQVIPADHLEALINIQHSIRYTIVSAEYLCSSLFNLLIDTNIDHLDLGLFKILSQFVKLKVSSGADQWHPEYMAELAQMYIDHAV